jgi:hypothetical protein
MKSLFRSGTLVVLIALILGCGSKSRIPPRINLRLHELIGIVEFSSSNKGKLGPYATEKFIEAIRRDQGMIRIVELGEEDEVLNQVGKSRLDQDAYKVLGEIFGVKSIISGELLISDVRPDISITPGLGFLSAGAEVDANLSVKLVETLSGASLWSGSGASTEQVAHVSIFGGKDISFDAGDPEKAYGRLIHSLVNKTSRDFKATWR